MIGVQTPTGAKGVAAFGIRTADGNKAVARASILTADGSKDFFVEGGMAGSLILSIDPVSAVGSGASAGSTTVFTNSVTTTATGGTAPYSYAWARTSGSTSWSINSPSSASTRFSILVAPSAVEDGEFECTVTDARGRTGTISINAAAFNFGDPFP